MLEFCYFEYLVEQQSRDRLRACLIYFVFLFVNEAGAYGGVLVTYGFLTETLRYSGGRSERQVVASYRHPITSI